MALTPLDEKRSRWIVDEVAGTRTALEQGEGQPAPARAARAARAAIWHWDLARGRVEWDDGRWLLHHRHRSRIRVNLNR